MAAHKSHADGHHGFAHPMPAWQLLAVFFALVLLTIATVYQSTLDLGNMELAASLVIATIKAALVIMFFMHMIYDKPLNAIIFLSSFVFVALFLGFTLMDAHAYQDERELERVDSPRAVAPDIGAPETADDSEVEPADAKDAEEGMA